MKVTDHRGKSKTRDHPHEIVSPHIMRFDEIRHWLKELKTNPAYGWFPGGRHGLERALGMHVDSLNAKLDTGWIYPREQVRLTHRIRDILEGRIVPRKFGKYGRVEGVVVDTPVPPVPPEKQLRLIKLKVQVGRVNFLPQDWRPPQGIPQVREAFKNVTFWDPDAKRARRVRPG